MLDLAPRKGIFYGWFILAVSFFVLFVSTGAKNGVGVFVVPMSDDFGWSRTSISLAIAIGYLVNGISQPFVGGLYDRFGGRKVITVSLLVLGLSTMLLGQTNSIWFFILVYGVVTSVAMGGVSFVTVHSLLAKWFFRKRGIVLSISTAGGSAGSIFLIPFAAYMILLSSWRTSWFALGAMVLFLALPLAWLMIRDDPADMGEVPDGAAGGRAGEGRRDSAARPTAPLEADHWRDAFMSRPMWQISGAYFVCGVTTSIISAHYVPFAIDRGISPGVAAIAFGLMMGLNGLGVLGVGFISDKVPRKNLLGIIYAGRGLAYVVLILAPGAAGIWGFAIAAGFFWVASAPLTSALTADIYGLKNIGTLNGMATMSHQMGGALSIYVAGVLYDLSGTYDLPFSIAGALLVAGSFAAFSVKEKRYSARYQPPVPEPAPATAGDAD